MALLKPIAAEKAPGSSGSEKTRLRSALRLRTVVMARGARAEWRAVLATVSLLEPRLDLLQAGLGAGFVAHAARDAVQAGGSGEADGADHVVADHEQQATRSRKQRLVRLDLGFESRILLHLVGDLGGDRLQGDRGGGFLAADLGLIAA